MNDTAEIKQLRCNYSRDSGFVSLEFLQKIYIVRILENLICSDF